MEPVNRRLRRFSIATWLVGVPLLAALVLLPGPHAALSAATGLVGWRTAVPGPLPEPWVDADFARTPAAQPAADGYRWESAGRAVLKLPEDLAAAGGDSRRPLRIVTDTDSYARLSTVESTPQGPVRRTLDENFDGFWDPDPRLALLPAGVDTLYVEAGGDWSIEMRTLEPIPLVSTPAEEGMEWLGEFQHTARGEGPGAVRYEDCSLTPIWDWSQFGQEQDLPHMALYRQDEDGFLIPEDEDDLTCSRYPGPFWVHVDTPDPWGLEFLEEL